MAGQEQKADDYEHKILPSKIAGSEESVAQYREWGAVPFNEEREGGSWSVFRDTYTNSEEKAAYYKKEEEGAQEVLDGRKKRLEELETKISKRTKKIKLNIVHSPKQSYKENKSFRQEFFWAIRG